MRRLRMHDRSDPKRKERRLLHRAALWIVEVRARKRHANQDSCAVVSETLCRRLAINKSGHSGTAV
jgi:hypothetical protein